MRRKQGQSGILTVAFLACLVGAFPVKAQDDQAARDRFKLWSGCAPLHPAEVVSPDAESIGLTREAVRLAVESRLRAARIYRLEQEGPYLSVRVGKVTHSFGVLVALRKLVYDPLSQKGGFAITWESSMFGIHGDSASYVLSALSQNLDKFISEYLRVNESAC